MIHNTSKLTPNPPIIAIDNRYFRPTVVETLLGDPAKAKTKLGCPPKISRIDSMAKSLSRSRPWVINQALERYISYEEWFAHEVKSGLDEMQNGDFASHEEISNKLQKSRYYINQKKAALILEFLGKLPFPFSTPTSNGYIFSSDLDVMGNKLTFFPGADMFIQRDEQIFGNGHI